MKFYSHGGQDRWAFHEVFQGKTDGLFLDIGAASAFDWNNTAALEEAGWTGTAVDPFLSDFEKRACRTIRAAVSSRAGEATFHSPGARTGGLESTLGRYARSQDNGQIATVPTITPDQLLDQIGNPDHIDFLSLDVEGHELEILRAWPFHRCLIRAIAV